jgi:excisionase family DNA binding protein
MFPTPSVAPHVRALTISQVSRILQVREPRVRQEIVEGRLEASRVGRLWRIRPEDVERYLEKTRSNSIGCPTTGAATA